MPHLSEARSVEEDWSGLRDPKARRKLQNRLNVRAHRRRKQLGHPCPPQVKSDSNLDFTTNEGDCFYRPLSKAASESCITLHEDVKVCSRAYDINKSPYVRQFIQARLFPLSPDHYIPLIQFNILRATFTNLAILGLLQTVPDECHSVSIEAPLFPFPKEFPESLLPTALQQSIEHDPWIDTLPDPQMRDNALNMMQTIDHQDLAIDLVGAICQGQNAVERTAVLVWRDPWRPEGWELTPGFAKKWGCLVKGCSRLIESTNRYRAERGEAPLIVEL